MKKLVLLFGLLLLITGLSLSFIDTPFKYLFQANANLTSGKIARAVKLLEEGYKKYPDNHKITFALAKAYHLAGETELANKVIFSKKTIDALKCDKAFRDFLADLSDANQNLGNKKLAKYFATQYLACEETPEASEKTVKSLLKIGHILPEKSIELWEKGFSIAHAIKEPELKESLKALLLPKYFELADSLSEKKKYKDALEILNRAKTLGKCAEVNYKKAKLYVALGEIDNAQKLFEEALQLDPDNDDYKLSYANALKNTALHTNDKVKRNEYFEKIKLLLAGDNDPRKVSLLNKILSLNAKYKIADSKLNLKPIGDYLYPSLTFKINPVSDAEIKKYKVIFLNDEKKELDEYEAPLTNEELNQVIEVTCRNPVENNNFINAKLFVNDELVKEYTNK